jgi:hypothetical protein
MEIISGLKTKIRQTRLQSYHTAINATFGHISWFQKTPMHQIICGYFSLQAAFQRKSQKWVLTLK